MTTFIMLTGWAVAVIWNAYREERYCCDQLPMKIRWMLALGWAFLKLAWPDRI